MKLAETNKATKADCKLTSIFGLAASSKINANSANSKLRWIIDKASLITSGKLILVSSRPRVDLRNFKMLKDFSGRSGILMRREVESEDELDEFEFILLDESDDILLKFSRILV